MERRHGNVGEVHRHLRLAVFIDVPPDRLHPWEQSRLPDGVTCCIPDDFTGDCIVDYADLAKIARYWLQNESSVDIAPLGGDNIINFLDLAKLAQDWDKPR